MSKAEDMANVGEAFMTELRRNDPEYVWNNCPSEWVCDQINKQDELKTELAAARAELERVRLETIEQCAKIVDGYAERSQCINGIGGWERCDQCFLCCGDKERAIATAIRALQPEEQKEGK